MSYSSPTENGASFRIVCSQSMHTGRIVRTGTLLRPILRHGRAGSAGDGGTWVYVALHGGCIRASPSLAPELSVWHRARSMRIAPRDAASRCIAGGAPYQIPLSEHYIHDPDCGKIIEAVNDLRDIWQMRLPVDWRVVTCRPDMPFLLPCQWPMFAVPMPECLVTGGMPARRPPPDFD